MKIPNSKSTQNNKLLFIFKKEDLNETWKKEPSIQIEVLIFLQQELMATQKGEATLRIYFS